MTWHLVEYQRSDATPGVHFDLLIRCDICGASRRKTMSRRDLAERSACGFFLGGATEDQPECEGCKKMAEVRR